MRSTRTLILAVMVMLAASVAAPLTLAGASHDYEPDAHWAAFSWGTQVTIVDHTGPWPVSLATARWQLSTNFTVHYHWSVCSHAVNCVDATEYSAADGYKGLAWIGFDSNGHPVGTPRVEFNNYYSCTGTCPGWVTCMEIGHILGLEHRSSGSSCMRDNSTLYTSPDSHDFSQLNANYDHG